MKNEKALYEQCSLILHREIEVLKKISAQQNLVWEAVASREWADFEVHNQAVNTLGGEFEALEAKREELLSRLKPAGGQEDEKKRFYAMISCFSPDLRNELTATYRTLKLETMKVRASNEMLLNYLSGAKTLMAGFLETILPERAGRLYTPQGTQAAADMRSVVLNRHF
ncbi:MAG: hypothetical protein LBP74_03795 [Treponema sp.]|jgi:hypothetical protein|nr:hypothetical protein [Treponema sp.]